MFSTKFACFSENLAPPTARPRQPASSSSTPALRPPARGSSGFLKVEPKVLMPDGCASWRAARMLRQRGLHLLGRRRRERERRARHHLGGAEVRAAGTRSRAGRARAARCPAGPATSTHSSTRERSPPYALAFIFTAPPTVPGMFTPNSRPRRPARAARAAAWGSRAPPPQTRRSPLCSIVASAPSSFMTSPRNPASDTRRFDPEPTTPTASRSSAAQRKQRHQALVACRDGRTSPPLPPVRIVVRRVSG